MFSELFCRCLFPLVHVKYYTSLMEHLQQTELNILCYAVFTTSRMNNSDNVREFHRWGGGGSSNRGSFGWE